MRIKDDKLSGGGRLPVFKFGQLNDPYNEFDVPEIDDNGNFYRGSVESDDDEMSALFHLANEVKSGNKSLTGKVNARLKTQSPTQVLKDLREAKSNLSHDRVRNRQFEGMKYSTTGVDESADTGLAKAGALENRMFLTAHERQWREDQEDLARKRQGLPPLDRGRGDKDKSFKNRLEALKAGYTYDKDTDTFTREENPLVGLQRELKQMEGKTASEKSMSQVATSLMGLIAEKQKNDTPTRKADVSKEMKLLINILDTLGYDTSMFNMKKKGGASDDISKAIKGKNKNVSRNALDLNLN